MIVHGTFQPNHPVFCDLPSCVSYCAQLMLSGAHAGQIALTISGATGSDCNQTFYGCYNFSTGQFQVTIPDDCCGPPPGLCASCNSQATFPPWSYLVSYYANEYVTYGPYCYVSLQDGNLNNHPDISPTWWQDVDCECSQGYASVQYQPCQVSTPGGMVTRPIPKYLCAKFTGIKKCADNTTIPDFYLCLSFFCQSYSYFGSALSTFAYGWRGEIANYGAVEIYMGNGCYMKTTVAIYDGSTTLFYGGYGLYCFANIGNSWVQSNCGQNQTMIFCSSYCCDHPSDPDCQGWTLICGCQRDSISRTVVGYGGSCLICDPNTGDPWGT